jgi:hypothetical protein
MYIIIILKKMFLVPKPHVFINISLNNSFFYLFTKLFIIVKNKRFIALLISSLIILCIKLIFNYYSYIINFSLLFIIFCGFLKPIILVIIEYINETKIFNFKLKKSKKLSIIFLSKKINKYKSTCINFNDINLYDIHIPLNLEKLKNASNLYEVDAFFNLIYKQEVFRHQYKLYELVYKAILTQKIQKQLINKIEEEYLIFKERLGIIEQDRCIHIVYLRVKKNIKF